MKNLINLTCLLALIPVALVASKMGCKRVSNEIVGNLFANPIMQWVDRKATAIEDYFDGTEEI